MYCFNIWLVNLTQGISAVAPATALVVVVVIAVVAVIVP